MVKGVGSLVLDVINTLHTLVDVLGKSYEKVPDTLKQRLPGFLGWSYEDERIFNGVLGQLSKKKQVVITDFLYRRCKDFQRNRFINIVAGMEVERKKVIVETAKGKKEITEGENKDRRYDFLNKFADVITQEFGGDLKKAYKYCVGGRLIMPDRKLQPIIDTWQTSCQMFNDYILVPLGFTSLADLKNLLKGNIGDNIAAINNGIESAYQFSRRFAKKC